MLRRFGITAREFEVAQLLTERVANKDIAVLLHISPRTVEKHVASLLRKTGHPDRTAFATATRTTPTLLTGTGMGIGAGTSSGTGTGTGTARLTPPALPAVGTGDGW
ncbi:helix-turn-helix transcriptional regulator [Streptomyces rubiginosohelvolus]